MLVEALVFGGDEGFRHVRGQAVNISRAAIARPTHVQCVAIAVNEFDRGFALGVPQLSDRRQARHAKIKRTPFPEGPPSANQHHDKDEQHQVTASTCAEKAKA